MKCLTACELAAGESVRQRTGRVLPWSVVPEETRRPRDLARVFEDGLEAYLAEHWPAWTERRKELAKQGDGYLADCKPPPTYAEAARTAGREPKLLYSLLENVMALVG